ncbi:MAG: hypothetical protein ACRDTH_02220 [Pseudonocardiaceae bacterium]
MAISDSPTLVDTSTAVAFLVPDHKHHDATFEALAQRQLGLAGHAAFETFSVLTRLPPPARRTPAAASRLLAANFPHTRFLSDDRAAALLTSLAGTGSPVGRFMTRSSARLPPNTSSHWSLETSVPSTPTAHSTSPSNCSTKFLDALVGGQLPIGTRRA